jgi:hypothetical protein
MTAIEVESNEENVHEEKKQKIDKSYNLMKTTLNSMLQNLKLKIDTAEKVFFFFFKFVNFIIHSSCE